MKKNMIIILLILIGCLFIIICGIAGYVLLSKSRETETAPIATLYVSPVQNIPVSNSPLDFTGSNFTDSSLSSLYNNNVTNVPAKRIDVISMEFMYQTLVIAKQKGWQGSGELNISFKDFDQAQLNNWVTRKAEKEADVTVPAELDNLYLSTAAKTEITEEIFKARQEYLTFIKKMGVNQAYIDEFTSYTFTDNPANFTYINTNDPNAPVSGVHPSSTDPRKYDYVLHTIDIYIPALLIEKSGILGELKNPKLLRDLGLRFTTYHEMTHILQHAVNQVNTVAGSKYPDINIESVSGGRKYNWGNDVTKDLLNDDIAVEAQADGTAFEVISNVYNFSPIQKELLWDYQFGRLEKAATLYTEMQDIFELNYPNYNPFDFPNAITNFLYKESYSDPVRVALMSEINTVDFAAFGGYFYPLTLEQLHPMWEFTKTVHK